MAEDILKPDYWAERLKQAVEAGELHRAVYLCPQARWLEIEARHRDILALHIKPHSNVIDVGCGYSRLLDLLPGPRTGLYAGIDISPDLLYEGVKRYNETPVPHAWYHGDVTAGVYQLDALVRAVGKFDWAVMISFRPMIIRNLGVEAWARAEANVRKWAEKLLYLECDPTDTGSVE